MRVNSIKTKRQNFKALHISRNIPEAVSYAIRHNPIIQKAKSKYTLDFHMHSEGSLSNMLHCMVSNPETDSFLGCFVAAPHSMTRAHHWFGSQNPQKGFSPMGKIISEINNIKSDFFENLVGKPRTLKDKLIAIKEAFKIAFSDIDNPKDIQFFRKMEQKYMSPAERLKQGK